MSKLDYDDSSHTYYVGKKLVPSVTQVLSSIPDDLLYNQAFINKTMLGTRVHAVCEILNNCGEITDKQSKEIGVEEKDIPYIDAWIKYVEENDIEIIDTEQKVFSAKHHFAGTLDLHGKNEFGEFILDIKTVAAMSPTVPLQLAAYVMAFNEMKERIGNPVKQRIAIQLKPDGNYQVYNYPIKTLRYDTSIFLAKLTSTRWDHENL